MNSGAKSGTTYPNIAPEFISDIRTETTYSNVATVFISGIRTRTTYPNVAPEFIVVPVLISEMNSGATLG
jgi:hypothetical protein